MDVWLYSLQETKTRTDEIKALDVAIKRIDAALRAGRFDDVNRWLELSKSLTLAPLVAVGLFRFSTAARRKHPERFPAWIGAITALHQRLESMGLDADHKLRGFSFGAKA